MDIRVDQVEAGRPDQRAQAKKDGGMRYPALFDQPLKQRRYDDDETDQSDRQQE